MGVTLVNIGISLKKCESSESEVISFFDKLALEAKAKAPAKQAENKD